MINILNLVYIVILMCVCPYEAKNDIQEVRLLNGAYDVRSIDYHQCFKVIENKRLNIVFEKFNANKIGCWKRKDNGFDDDDGGDEEPLVESSEDVNFDIYGNGTSILKISAVERKMSTKWRCRVVDDSKNHDNIIFFEIKVNAPDIQEYRINISNDSKNVFYEQMIIVEKGKPIHILFSNMDKNNETMSTAQLRCKTECGPSFYTFYGCTNTSKKPDTILEIPADKVTVDISTKWSCTEENKVIRTFIIKVKASKKVDAYIGGRPLSFKTNGLVKELDGIFEHKYEDGETIEFTCKNIYKVGSTRLRYYDKHGNKQMETDEVIEAKKKVKTALSLRALLREENNGSYVECIYITPTSMMSITEFLYRIVFIVNNEVWRNRYIVTINGTKLSLPYDDSGILKYNYKFVAGENLNISCSKTDYDRDDKLHASIRYNNLTATATKGPNNTLPDDGKMTHRFYLNTESLEGAVLQCYSNKMNYTGVDIVFNEEHNRDPVVLGLRGSGVLFEYSENDSEWITHYEYNLNEKLNLVCKTSTESKLYWILERRSEPHSNGTYKNIFGNFHLDSDYNNTKIVCKVVSFQESDRRVTVLLQQKSEKEEVPTGGNGNDELLIIGICVIGILVLTVVAVCAFFWFKRKRNSKQNTYENFSNSDTPIPAFPNQWENNEYTYIINSNNYVTSDANMCTNDVMVENSLYTGNFNIKRITACSSAIENPYAEIDDIKNDNLSKYVIPYEQHDLRNNRNNINNSIEDNLRRRDDNSPTYAVPYEDHEIRSKNNPRLRPSKHEYAEIDDSVNNKGNTPIHRDPYEQHEIRKKPSTKNGIYINAEVIESNNNYANMQNKK